MASWSCSGAASETGILGLPVTLQEKIMNEPETSPPDMTAEDDTEGQAFKWQIVDDPKGGRQLRQGWTPDEPQSGRGRPSASPKDKGNTTR
jgi:hypothetical protein